MNRVDLALGTTDVYWADEADAEWVTSHGRTLRRRARLDRDSALRLQAMPLCVRLRGWRRYGQPRDYSFTQWSPWMTADGYRAQLHLAVLAGSKTAVRHLSQGLVDDVQGAA